MRGEKVSVCGSTSRLWLPGTTRMQPLSGVLGESAIQAVTMSAGSSPQ